jgi:hypothetical protein
LKQQSDGFSRTIHAQLIAGIVRGNQVDMTARQEQLTLTAGRFYISDVLIMYQEIGAKT